MKGISERRKIIGKDYSTVHYIGGTHTLVYKCEVYMLMRVLEYMCSRLDCVRNKGNRMVQKYEAVAAQLKGP